jgi:hypothetical protein
MCNLSFRLYWFFYTSNNGLNITSNWVAILSNIYPISIEEVLKILNNINIAKCPGVGSPSYEILPEIFPQL